MQIRGWHHLLFDPKVICFANRNFESNSKYEMSHEKVFADRNGRLLVAK